LRAKKLIFWDFDGVIKDSLNIKEEAFVLLFEHLGDAFCNKVRKFHLENGGISRVEKIKTYLRWAGLDDSEPEVNSYCNKFSDLVVDAVIRSPWVPGVESYIKDNLNRQKFVLVTATPVKEIEYILAKIDLINSFLYIFGSPQTKYSSLIKTFELTDISPLDSLFIGDSKEDFTAAKRVGVDFLLRAHDHNKTHFHNYEGNYIKDFVGI
jgi:phosphoglycolate phosphatase-like HAD superfamily hydrolase